MRTPLRHAAAPRTDVAQARPALTAAAGFRRVARNAFVVRARLRIAALLAAVGVLVCAPMAAARSADVAALQVALRAIGLYDGAVDGDAGPGTRAGVARFQARRGLAVDGVAGPRTRRALGSRGRPALGARAIVSGTSGWDVAALQWHLSIHGFPSGAFDGGFGARTRAALIRFQAWAGLAADGVAGPGTLAALRRPAPASVLRFAAPIAARASDRFGPRGGTFHTGLDYAAPLGQPVSAAGRGCVSWAGYDSGGYGNLVIIRHRLGMATFYAHLSSIAVRQGQCVVAGDRVGRVGSTGHSTGPHLHFEMRLRSAAVDPLTGL
jgi:murein DD-endopeptidase MepM/ murein hydrolase activator NlpD